MSEEIVFCRGGGCTAKLGPGVLARVLNRLPKTKDPNLMIGYDGSDDAAVYGLQMIWPWCRHLIFFLPWWRLLYIRQVAAANALSDIYAMGGEVKTALNIVCFPEEMDLNILGKIHAGRQRKGTRGRRCSGGRPFHCGQRCKIRPFCYGNYPS